MSLPESRRDSAEVENFRENNMMYKNNGQQQQHFKREEFLDTFNSQPKVGNCVSLTCLFLKKGTKVYKAQSTNFEF